MSMLISSTRKREYLRSLLQTTVLENKYIRQKPTPKQARFLIDLSSEVLFGGAAGGGKSSAILMAALQFVDVPRYSAIIFRRTYADLSLPGALMDRAREWLAPTNARWSSDAKTWHFPSGATLTFGYLDSAGDRFRYQSTEFHFVGFDELSQFKKEDYLYLFSRIRRLATSRVPARMRCGSNPGGIGHVWVKRRFLSVDAEKFGRRFIPSKLEDNPHVDQQSYDAMLSKLDSFTRRQLRDGDWSDFHGKWFFPSGWPRYTDMGDAYSIPLGGGQRRIHLKRDCPIIVGLDWALNKRKRRKPGENPEWASEEKAASDNNAFVVAALTPESFLLILDCVKTRVRPEGKAKLLAQICRRYRPIAVAGDDDMLSEALLLECRRHGDIPEIRCLPISGRSKAERATAAIIKAENGLVFLPDREHEWLEEFCDDLAAFTGDGEDDSDDVPDALGIVARQVDEMRGDGAEESEPDAFGAPNVFGGTW